MNRRVFPVLTLSLATLSAIAFSVDSVDAFQNSQVDLPHILILGDSISMGYKPLVEKKLADLARVSRPTKNGKEENCSGTIHGVANIDRWLTDAGKVDLIFFNFGLHDLKRVDATTRKNSNDPSDPRQSEPDVYHQQLTTIVERLKSTGARLVYVTTTPVPAGGVRPFRSIGDSLYYNAIARTVVEPRGIEVLDLYQPALDHQEQWQKPVDVHFNGAGNEGLATLLSDRARALLSNTGHARKKAGVPWEADPALVERLAARGDFNYRESDVVPMDLPAVFDSDQIKTADDWEQQQTVLLGTFADCIYGRAPAELQDATINFEARSIELPAGIRPMNVDEVTTSVHRGEKEIFKFPFLYFRPQGDGPFPAIVLIHNRQYPNVETTLNKPVGFLPVEMLIEQGYAVAVFHTSHVEPDRADAGTDGIRFACDHAFNDDRQRSDYWGCLTAWAWGASRVTDFLSSQDIIRSNQIAVIGHSRGGKTALWAAAQDDRFAAAVSNESGCGGAALSRRAFGETIGQMSRVIPYWFAPQFAEFADRESELPVDQHQLVALIAPRLVAIGSAAEDLWADPRGEYLSLVHAAPVFTLFDRQSIASETMLALGEQRIVGATSYHVRPGAHNLTEGDWLRYITFLNGHWKNP